MLVHTTDFLPDGAPLWLPTYLMWFIGGMLLAALSPLGVKAYAAVCVPLALACYFIAATPIAGAPTTSPAELREGLIKTLFYAVISTLVVAPLGAAGPRPRAWLVSAVHGEQADGVPRRDLV